MIRKVTVLILFLCSLCSLASGALAHNFNNGYSYVHFKGNTLDFQLLLPYPILLQYDLNQDQVVTDDELEKQKDAIAAYMKEHLLLFNNLRPMDFAMVGMKNIIQKDTEDHLVQFDFRYTSESNIESLQIIYDVVLSDVDPTHQNYIQMYNGDDKMVAQKVVEKIDNKFDYVAGGTQQFPGKLLGLFSVLGVQHIVRSPAFWLFVLCLAIPAVGIRTLFETAVIFSVANLLGNIVSFRTGYSLPVQWVSWFAVALVFCLAADNYRQLPWSWRKPAAALFGGLHGLGTFKYILGLGAPGEYKIIFLIAYDLGIFLAIAGLVYVFCMLFSPFRRFGWFRKAQVSGSVLISAVNLFILISGWL